MSTLRIAFGAALLLIGCTPVDPNQNTFPQQPEPTQVAGPPGGTMDPGYGPQQQPQPQPVAYNGDPQQYQQGGYEQPADDQGGQADQTAAPAEPSADPNDPGYDMGQVNDQEIDATLDGYGQWEETEDYGRVWRPDTTAVGVDFTPYETDGSWIYSDAGWNYQCDLSWGWLPFHYGRWGWFDNYWGWQPGNTWSTGAVEWRGGGGYTGWRPLTPIIRDHRTGAGYIAPNVTAHDSQWRFTANNDFGHGHIKGHLFQNPSEGLRLTSNVARPGVRANYSPVSSASIMRGRLQSNYARANAPVRANNGAQRPQQAQQGYRPQGSQGFRQQQPYRGETQTWRPQQQQQGYRAPQQQGYRAPQTYRAPQQQSYRPQQSYRAPQQQWNRGSYQAPQRSYQQAPSHTYTAPSHSTYTAPSHSSGGGGSYHSSGGGGSYHGGGGGGGGGGRHR